MISPRLALVLFVLPTAAIAQDIPVINWTVPPYRAASASGGLSPMVDISPGVAFTAVTPCRVVDTRNAAGPYGGPPLATNVFRSFDINSGPCAAIPAAADAYSLSIGAILPPADGFLSAWPTGTSQPLISQLNFVAGEVIANAAIVPAGTGGSINVLVNIGPTNVYIDINGYFTADQNAGQFFEASGSRAGPVILGENSSNASNAEGVRGVITSSTMPGVLSAGVRGIIQDTGTSGSGVFGSHAGEGTGVWGESVSGAGIVGQTTTTTASRNTFGVRGVIVSPFPGSAAVSGFAHAPNGLTYGVSGGNASASNDSAGVRGTAGQAPSTFGTAFSKSGVRGESETGYGTIGISDVTAVGGFLMDPSDNTILAQGLLGTIIGLDPDPGPPWAVHAVGKIGATGVKAFLEPHPSDPTRIIQYVALEGPEAGTYFRGRARFQRGLATIPVPEDFRMVTDPQGLTVQITPIGEMASFAVVRMGLDQIVVKSSRDVEFSYFVQGVRASFKDVQPVIRDGTFVPQSAEAKMPSALAERQKRLLIQNGAYKEDGSVNMETARRLGWDRMWERRSASPETAAED